MVTIVTRTQLPKIFVFAYRILRCTKVYYDYRFSKLPRNFLIFISLVLFQTAFKYIRKRWLKDSLDSSKLRQQKPTYSPEGAYPWSGPSCMQYRRANCLWICCTKEAYETSRTFTNKRELAREDEVDSRIIVQGRKRLVVSNWRIAPQK